MHAKSSYESINGLVKNGIKRPVLAHSLKVIGSQRLVRRLCTYCRESFVPDKYTIALINNIFELPNPKKMKYINKLEYDYISEINHVVPKASQLNTSGSKIKRIYMAHKEGCDKCYHTGYKGQIGLFETIRVTDSIQKLILSLASQKVLMNKAIAEGTTDLLIDGLIKALAGQTSIHELFRIHQNM
jgi:type II secretory ATPase GspE/PulE/Tfp pilus assembly ATPase PilB-like protein